MLRNKNDILKIVQDYNHLRHKLFEYAKENHLFDKSYLREKEFSINPTRNLFYLVVEDYMHGDNYSKTYTISFDDFLSYCNK